MIRNNSDCSSVARLSLWVENQWPTTCVNPTLESRGVQTRSSVDPPGENSTRDFALSDEERQFGVDASNEYPNKDPLLPDTKDSIYRTGSIERRRRKKCYICCFLLIDPHRLYPSLCKPCGAFNLAESTISLPPNLNLHQRTAVVTGGRINLGFRTALRLLRCGAKVIVTSRYPHDTERRYREQPDWQSWSDRLRIAGADFRTAKDVFQLVTAIRNTLRTWAGTGEPPRLDILVNNAAQTLTDPVPAERKAIAYEETLMKKCTNSLIRNTDYHPRVRGGTMQPWGLLEMGDGTQHTTSYSSQKTESSTLDNLTPRPSTELSTSTGPSSWVQSLPDIPYEDFITAYSVNSLVPMILVRELIPMMTRGLQHFKSSDAKTVPVAYIINISSREGIFEETPHTTAKNGKHLHTNMSKAALNSITQTEALTAWKRHKIAINSVDPGFMSAAPEMRDVVGECPIGFEDGAARALWPVAMGEKGEAVWGRFLKHFGRIDVDVGLGQ